MSFCMYLTPSYRLLYGTKCSNFLGKFKLGEVSTGESSPVHEKDCDDNSTSATDVTIGNDLALPDAVVGQ